MQMKEAQIVSKIQGQADRTSLFSRPSFTFDSDRPQNTGDSNPRGGFTLMELVVYIAIMGIVVIVAGQAFSNSTKFRVRNQSMVEANEVAGNISAIIRDDVAQMGAKSSKETQGAAASDEFSSVYSDVYMNAATDEDAKRDSSSFKLEKINDQIDDLTLRRVRYDSDGKYVSVEEVRWFVEGSELKRSCWTVAKKAGLDLAADDPCAKTSKSDASEVVIADGVTSFNIVAGKPKFEEEDIQMFPPTGNEFMLIPRYGENHYNIMNVENDGTSSRLSGFALNYDKFNNKLMDAASDPETVEKNQLYAAEYKTLEETSGSTWKSLCSGKNSFTFDPLVVYEISFKMPPPPIRNAMEMFTPGRDFLAVGFRDNEGNKSPYLKDFLFYPPTTQEALGRERKMRFAVPQKVEGQCLAFTFVSYSPVTSEGTMFIDDLKLKRVATANYEFPEAGWNTEDDSNIVEKKNVKAFKITLTVQRNGEGGVVETVVHTPSNGPKD